MDQRPIGVFDSGLGGLTAVHSLWRILPEEDLIYFGDTARVPYGSRSREAILKYARQDVRFLRSFDLKAILIACGTVTTTSLAALQAENDLLAQQIDHRKETWADFSAGCSRFIVGLGKKVLLSNQLAVVADRAFGLGDGLSASFAWLGALCYTLQIYYDFSGYSDMAIGLGRIFGFRFNENFDHPYCADSVGTFWRRWHMSLTSWFRDYLYIPLGGNRGGTARTIRNLLIVWFCTGFWHGASWNFILWGLYFAAWLILERYVLRGVLEKTPAILKHLYTLIVVFVGWGLFAMVDLGVCGDYLAACFGGAPLWSGADLFRLRSYAVTLAVLVLASTALGQRLWAKLPRQAEQLATPVLMGLSLVVCTAYLVDGSYNPFLYFRF